jgi:hypothetical protein
MKVIGIDPDCDKSGLAFYENGVLTGLMNLNVSDYAKMLPEIKKDGYEIAIEDANMIKTTYGRNRGKLGQGTIDKNIGKVMRQCSVMIELAESAGIKVTRYTPTKANWETRNKSKLSRAKLKATTGYGGKSNPETRSAAYFGYTHCNRSKLK